jgi:protein-L-isoaspartate(D-aspartate) O-methyltransferase
MVRAHPRGAQRHQTDVLTPQHAYASEYLLPYLHPGARVLDVGSGSGYLTAVLHRLVGSAGTVVGIDHVPELVEWSVDNLKTDGLGEALAKKEIEMVTGDGRKGFPSSGSRLSPARACLGTHASDHRSL